MNRLIRIALAGALTAAGAGPASAGSGCGLDVDPAALDSNHNAELSRNETAGSALADVFDRVDSNGDGVISQPEFAGRCASLQATENKDWAAGWDDTVAGEKAQRQTDRQKSRVNSRVDQETDKATDSMVDKAMGAIFGK